MDGARGVLQPVIRTNWAKLAIGRVKRLPEPHGTRVLEALGDVRVQVRDAGMLEWKPAELFVQVTEVIAATLGPRGGRAFWRDVMLAAFDRKFLQPLVHGALVIHGRKPSSILRMTPQAYSLSFKNCGISRLYETDAPNRVRLQFEGLPPVLYTSDAAMGCFAGNCDAAIKYFDMSGTATRVDDDLARGRLHYDVEWQA